MYACFSNNGGEVTKEKIDVSVHSGQTIMRQMVLLTMFKLKKMKDREFSTKKLAESIKVLRKASGVNVKEFCKSIHMTECGDGELVGVFGGGEERGVVRSMQIGHSFNNIRCLRKCLYRWEYSFLNVDKRRIFCDVSNWVT